MWVVSTRLKCLILPLATKLGQGYIFTGVCDSVHRGGTWAGTPPLDQVHPPGPGTPPGAVHAGRYGQQAGGTHPTGMHSCCLKLIFCVYLS